MGESTDQTPTLDEVFEQLAAEGLLTDQQYDDVVRTLRSRYTSDDDPWYVQAVSGLGAWLAAMAFVGFLGCSGALDFGRPFAYGVGGFFLVVGTAVRLRFGNQGVFLAQLALACSLVGQGILVGSLVEQQGLPTAALVYGTAVVGPLYALYRSDIHRFVTVLAGLTLGSVAFADAGIAAGQTVLFGGSLAAMVLVFSGRSLPGFGWRVVSRPIGYAATVTAIWTSSEFFLHGYLNLQSTGLHRGLAAIAFGYLAVEALREGGSEWVEPACWGAAVVVSLAVLSTPGLLVAMLVLFLGVWRGSSALTTVGVLALGYYLWALYYSLEMSLLVKSGVLVGTGVVLLLARWWFANRPWNPEAGPTGQDPSTGVSQDGQSFGNE